MGKYSLITAARELELADRIAGGDLEARDELVTANLRFVLVVAALYRGYGVEFDDLVAEGNYGLIVAAEKFRREPGVRFLSYARWWIIERIQRAISYHSRVVSTPANSARYLKTVRAAEWSAGGRSDTAPDESEVVAATGLRPSEVRACVVLRANSHSLDKPLPFQGNAGGEKKTYLDMMRSDAEPPDAGAIRSDIGAKLAKAMAYLRPRDAAAIIHYYGLDESRVGESYHRVGRRLGLSPEGTRQSIRRGIRRLKRTSLIRETQRIAG